MALDRSEKLSILDDSIDYSLSRLSSQLSGEPTRKDVTTLESVDTTGKKEQETGARLSSEVVENGESSSEMIHLKQDIAVYEKLKEDIAIEEQKLRDFPKKYEEEYRKVVEILLNNKSIEPGNLTFAEKRNLFRGTATDAEAGKKTLLSLLDELDGIKKGLEIDNQGLGQIDRQIRSTVIALAGKILNKEALDQIKAIAIPLPENDGIKQLLLTLPVQQTLISRKDVKKELIAKPEISHAVVSNIDELKVVDSKDESFAVDSEGGAESKIDKMLGEKGGGFMTDAEAEAVGKRDDQKEVVVTDPDKDEIDRKVIKDSSIAEYNFTPSPEPKPETVTASQVDLNKKKDESTELIQQLDGASEGAKDAKKPEDSKPEEPTKVEIPVYTDPIGMVKVKPNGEAEEEKTLTAKNSVDINVPNTEKLSNGAERIDKIRKLISGEKPPVTISEEKKKAIQQKLEGLRKIEASKVTPTISKDTKTESGLVKPSIEDELLKDVPETVEGIEGASIGESKGEIVSENVSGEKAIDNPAEVKADNPIKPVVTEQQVKPITQEQPAKHVEQENKSSIFGRFSKWVKVVGKNPDSSGAARLVEIQKANKN